MPCKETLPRERSLVAKLEGKPFVFLGINCDPDQETLRVASHRQHLNWQNWWNGGPTGRYIAQYAVDSFPTTFVVDEAGIIRFRGRPGPAMEEAVERLVIGLEATHNRSRN
jgi:hypothetical protein